MKCMIYKLQVYNQKLLHEAKAIFFVDWASSISKQSPSNIVRNRAAATRDNHSHRWAERFHSRIDCAPARKGCGISFMERESSTDLHSLLLRHASFFLTSGHRRMSRYIQHFKAFFGDDRYWRDLLNPFWTDGTFKYL